MKEKRTISEIVIILYCIFIILEIWLPIDDIFILGLVAILIFPFVKKHTIELNILNKGLLFLGGFFLYATITSFWSPASSGFLVIRYWALYISLFLMCQVKLSSNTKKIICNSILIVGVIFSIICILYGNIKYGRLELLSFSGDVAADPNTICSWLILPCAIASNYLVISSKWKKLIYCILIVLYVYIALLTESRGGLLALLITISATFIGYIKNNNFIKMLIAIITVLVLMYIGLHFLPYNVLLRFRNISTLGGRRDIWNLLIKKWWNTPSIMVWGAGVDSVTSYTKFLVAHNIYIKFLFEEGIVGLGLFLSFIICTCKRAVKTGNKLGIAAFMGMLFLSITLDTDTYKSFWLVLFIAMSNINIDNKMVVLKNDGTRI